MPTKPRPASKPRRGRPPRTQEATPTGYRATAVTRRQLEMARLFTGHGSLQSIIDGAVRSYLANLASKNPGYRTALSNLDPALLVSLEAARPDQAPD